MLYSLYLFHYILLYFLGRFDLNKCAVQCSSCHHAETLTWTLRDVVVAGYWPGSPTDTSYVFVQQLFFFVGFHAEENTWHFRELFCESS